jgi:hypothetical protein
MEVGAAPWKGKGPADKSAGPFVHCSVTTLLRTESAVAKGSMNTRMYRQYVNVMTCDAGSTGLLQPASEATAHSTNKARFIGISWNGVI